MFDAFDLHPVDAATDHSFQDYGEGMCKTKVEEHNLNQSPIFFVFILRYKFHLYLLKVL